MEECTERLGYSDAIVCVTRDRCDTFFYIDLFLMKNMYT